MAARILMVDDVESNLVALEAILGAPGTTLVRARSGLEALRALLEDDFSLILLDVQMPEMDGFDTAALIRARPKTRGIPIIFVTAHGSSAELTSKAYAVGAVDFLAKPFEPQALRAKVATFTDLARRVEEAKIQTEALHQQQLREERQRWEADALRAQVTQEREATAIERAARHEAENANRIKDEFLATLSHELRTPLNTILGWVNVLKGKAADRPPQQHGLSVIERNARLQAKLIENMLDVSRIVAGQLRIDEQTVRLAPLVSRVVSALHPDAVAKGITVNTRLEDDLPPVVGDPSRLQQVFTDLLSNAVKFTPSGGRVAVEVERAGDEISIRVVDSGIGIPAAFLPHVFEHFRQGDGATTRAHGGLGLGLSMAQHLVRAHGGQLRAHSDGAGAGSTFVVTLPVRAIPEDSATAADELPVATNGEWTRPLAAVRIMLVDDEAEAREVLTELLEMEGATVLAVDSAHRALQLLPEWRPTVLVSDIGMPEEDGYSLIGKIRSLPESSMAAVPAIALTAYTSVDDIRRARAAGFHLHLAKPVDPPHLVATIVALARGARG